MLTIWGRKHREIIVNRSCALARNGFPLRISPLQFKSHQTAGKNYLYTDHRLPPSRRRGLTEAFVEPHPSLFRLR